MTINATRGHYPKQALSAVSRLFGAWEAYRRAIILLAKNPSLGFTGLELSFGISVYGLGQGYSQVIIDNGNLNTRQKQECLGLTEPHVGWIVDCYRVASSVTLV